jgi:hypothetical protein
MAGTSAVIAAERVFQSPAGAASQAGAAGAVAVADMAGGPFREPGAGLDLAAEGEGGDRRAAEGFGYRLGYGVGVFPGGDAGQVGDGGVLAEDAGDLREGEQFAQLGCPADLAAGLPGGEVPGGPDGAGVDLEGAGEVVIGGNPDLRTPDIGRSFMQGLGGI